MQVTLNNGLISPKYNSYKPVTNSFDNGVSFGCFRKILKNDLFQFSLSPLDRAMSKLHNISKAEYDVLSEVEKAALREKIETSKGVLLNSTIQKDINYHHFATESIKKVFDKQYGEGNYVVVTIGRSLSSISKLLEMKIGSENVKNIPLSNLGSYWTQGNHFEYYNSSLDKFVKRDGFEKFKNYLSSVGLSRAEVESSNKNYIIMDYASSGNSLESGYTLLTSDVLLGNTKRNITFASMKDITDATGKQVESHILDHYLDGGLFKKYAFVGKSNNLGDIEKSANYETHFKLNKMVESVKLFGFALLDSMYSGKKIPYANEIDVVEPVCPFKKVWNSFNKQFACDIYEDSMEFCKFLNKQVNEEDFGKHHRMFLQMQLDYRYPSSLVKSQAKGQYYTEFRPQLLELLNKG